MSMQISNQYININEFFKLKELNKNKYLVISIAVAIFTTIAISYFAYYKSLKIKEIKVIPPLNPGIQDDNQNDMMI